MIAFDTNLLVRALVADNPDQVAVVRQLITADTIFIPRTVLLESKRSAPPPLEEQDHAGLLSGLRGNNSSMRLFGQEGSFSRVLVSQAMGSMSFMRAVSSRD